MTNNIDSTPIGLLTGKVLFITGASRGIGAAAAALFAREGAAVVLAARSASTSRCPTSCSTPIPLLASVTRLTGTPLSGAVIADAFRLRSA
jgi:NAD(P)-dependent dehydrogenase (short-subunit alcohol dehydrogenase family)